MAEVTLGNQRLAGELRQVLQRDLDAFFTAKIKESTHVEYRVFDDASAQSEIVGRRWVAWVRILQEARPIEEGVVEFVTNGTRLHVISYASASEIRSNSGVIFRNYRPELAKAILAKANPVDERQDRQDLLCSHIPSQKARIERLRGRDPNAMAREGYPSDPVAAYERAREIGSRRDAWGAIIMVQEGIGMKADLQKADELWRDFWCADVLPETANRPDLAFVDLAAAAKRGLPSAMLRISEVYAKGEFRQPLDIELSRQWRAKYEAVASRVK